MQLSPQTSAETRRILSLAWPVILTSLNWTVLQVTDIVVVGLVGADEVAAMGANRALTVLGIMVAIGMLSSVLVFAARTDGAGEKPATGRVFHDGLVLSAGLGLVLFAVLYGFAHPLLQLIGVEPTVARHATRVVEVTAMGYPFFLISIAGSMFLEGVSRPRRVAVVNLIQLPINGVLAWAWSGGHWGLPALGAVGAAGATSVSCVLGAVGMMIAVWTLPDARARGVRAMGDLFSGRTLRGAWALLVFGAVPALASGMELMGFSILIGLSTRLGDATAHAFQIVFSIHNVTFGVAMGLGSAAGVRAGNAVGEGVPAAAWHRTMVAVTLAAIATATLAVVLLTGDRLIVGLFPATTEVHMLAALMLMVWAPFIVFDGAQIVFLYALRSLGDQVVSGLNAIVAYFLVTGSVGWALVHHGWGPTGLALASGIGMLTAAGIHGGRFVVIIRRLRRKS